jgi:diacylglycerol kinase
MWKRELKSFGYAFKGIRSAFRSEPHMRFHAFAAVCVLACSAWVQLSAAEFGIIILCIGAVFAAELVNTALEKMVDLVSPGYHEKAGAIKDIAAGAVLVVSVAAAAAGIVLLFPRVLNKIIVMFM